MKEGFSSPEPLLAIRWRQEVCRWKRVAEDGARCLHCEDKVEVGNHHGDARQKGKPKPKTTDAAAEGCRNPINESGNNTKPHGGCCVMVTQKQKVEPYKDCECLTVRRQR